MVNDRRKVSLVFSSNYFYILSSIQAEEEEKGNCSSHVSQRHIQSEEYSIINS